MNGREIEPDEGPDWDLLRDTVEELVPARSPEEVRRAVLDAIARAENSAEPADGERMGWRRAAFARGTAGPTPHWVPGLVAAATILVIIVVALLARSDSDTLVATQPVRPHPTSTTVPSSSTIATSTTSTSSSQQTPTSLSAPGAGTTRPPTNTTPTQSLPAKTPPPTSPPSSVSTPSSTTSTPPQTYLETTGGTTNTWSDYVSAGGTHGQTIPTNTGVQIRCRIEGFAVQNGNTWWYRIAQQPWNDQYYASADAFYNNGQTSGSLVGTPFFDPAVPIC